MYKHQKTNFSFKHDSDVLENKCWNSRLPALADCQDDKE